MITLTPGSADVLARRSGVGGAVAEHYDSLVHWLRAVGGVAESPPKSIGLTSCTHGAGVSSAASNLAIAAAQVSNEPVLLLDLSTPRYNAATRLTGAAEPGLCEALADVEHAISYARQSPIANLLLLGFDSADSRAVQSLVSSRLEELLASLERDLGFIVVDLPTVDSSVCFVAAGLLDGVLMVVEAERTRLERVARAKQRLIDARARVLGVILNKHPQHLPNWLETRI